MIIKYKPDKPKQCLVHRWMYSKETWIEPNLIVSHRKCRICGEYERLARYYEDEYAYYFEE